MTTLPAGTRLGRYEIRSALGAGGMGQVYLAEDTELGRRVALKVLPSDMMADEVARKRLLREARAAATLDHPHICSVYEVGEAGRGAGPRQAWRAGSASDLTPIRQQMQTRACLPWSSRAPE
jgi:serine/threonine-protein kinase